MHYFSPRQSQQARGSLYLHGYPLSYLSSFTKESFWEGIPYYLLILEKAGWKGNKELGGDANSGNFSCQVKCGDLKPPFSRFTKWLVFLLGRGEPQLRSLFSELLHLLTTQAIMYLNILMFPPWFPLFQTFLQLHLEMNIDMPR